MADHIQIGDVVPRIQYTGDGSQTVFTYPFPLFADADMEIYLDQTKQSTGFAVNGAGQSAGGDVTFDAAPGSGVLVTLRRRLAIQRTSDFQESGEFRSKVINDELDYLTAALQQVSDDGERSLKLGATDPTGSLTLPDKTTRADMFLGFDADGDPVATDASGPQGPTGPAGNMDGSNNLSELTDPSAARTSLGLGSAATKDVGTGQGDVVELDAAGLPAVDGSQLLNLAGDATARANIVLNAFNIQIQHGLSVLNMVDGFVDQFEDQTGVDDAGSTDAGYSTAGDYYTSQGAGISASGEWAGATADFTFPGNDVEVAANDNFIYTNDEFSGDFEFIYTYKTDETDISTMGLFEASNKGSVNPNGNTQTGISGWFWQQHSTNNHLTDYENIDNVSTNDFDMSVAQDGDRITWRRVGDTISVLINDATVHTFATTSSATLSFFLGTGNGSTGHILDAQWWFYPGLDMTMISEAVTAAAQPDEAFIVLHEEDVDAVTLNTDLKAWASRDGGTTWTQITLAEEAASFSAAGRILSGTADISGQPAGTSMKYKITTHNTKALNVHGVGFEWS